MRFERAYSQGNLIKTQPVAAVLVKTVENRKKQATPYVPQSAVRRQVTDIHSFYATRYFNVIWPLITKTTLQATCLLGS
jgi:hypothetical protein